MANVSPGTELARRLAGEYERGLHTQVGMIALLVPAAAEHPPAELAAGLPDEWVAELRQETAKPPASASDVIYVRSICAGPGFDSEALLARMRQACYDGSWNWHRFFGELEAALGTGEPGA